MAVSQLHVELAAVTQTLANTRAQCPLCSVLSAVGESCLHQVLEMVWIAKRGFRKF